MMPRDLWLFGFPAVAFLYSFAQADGSPSKRSASDVAAIEVTLRGFFEALRRDDKAAFNRLTTRSFYAFDGGERLAADELFEAVRKTHSTGVEMNWSIGKIDAHATGGMAWASWENEGSVGRPPKLKPVRWLESAVLVKRGQTWRIQFLHSGVAKQAN